MLTKCAYADSYQAKRVPKCGCTVCDRKWFLARQIALLSETIEQYRKEFREMNKKSKKPPRPPQRRYKNGTRLPDVPNLPVERVPSLGTPGRPKQRTVKWN